MRRVVAILALMLAFPAAVMADGTFPFDDLKPILNKKPALAKYLLTTLDFAEGGMAARVGSNVNERLGGKRLGPYRIFGRDGAQAKAVAEAIAREAFHNVSYFAGPLERLRTAAVR